MPAGELERDAKGCNVFWTDFLFSCILKFGKKYKFLIKNCDFTQIY